MSGVQKQSIQPNVQYWSKVQQIINSNNAEIFVKSVLSSSYNNILGARKVLTFTHTVQFFTDREIVYFMY